MMTTIIHDGDGSIYAREGGLEGGISHIKRMGPPSEILKRIPRGTELLFCGHGAREGGGGGEGGHLQNKKDGAPVRDFEKNPKRHRGPVLWTWLKFSSPLPRDTQIVQQYIFCQIMFISIP